MIYTDYQYLKLKSRSFAYNFQHGLPQQSGAGVIDWSKQRSILFDIDKLVFVAGDHYLLSCKDIEVLQMCRAVRLGPFFGKNWQNKSRSPTLRRPWYQWGYNGIDWGYVRGIKISLLKAVTWQKCLWQGRKSCLLKEERLRSYSKIR